jgi:mono/diheme cytochrome c family protein
MKKAVSVILCLLIVSVVGAWAGDKVPGDVASLFQKRCAVCHKGKMPPQGLSWEPGRIAEAIDRPSAEMPELKIIDTASPESSYILKKIRREDGIKGRPMPPPKALDPDELKLIENWVLGLKEFPAFGSANGAPDGAPDRPEPTAQAQAGAKSSFDTPAFFGTRLINLPTTTTPSKGDVLFRVAHRFADPVDTGFDNLFGMDSYANILLSLGYGITDNLAVTIGRTRTYREFELSADWLLAEQGKTAGLPFSATLHGGASLVTDGSPDEAKLYAAVSLSRQFTRRLSVLVVPAIVTNANHFADNPESTFSLGVGARYMIFNEFSIIAEWVPALAGYKEIESGWGLGIEKRIGGHVFQVFVNNALGLTPAQYLPGGDLRLGDLDLRIGFNIFRTF